jgi:hypothetical protein
VPVHQGRAVSFRPPRWAEHGREGSIEVPASCPLLVVEGDGAGRREAAHLIDALIWVQSAEREAERRSLARAEKPDAMDTANMPADGSCLPPAASGWPRKYPSTPLSGPGSGPTSLSAAPRRSPATPSPRSSSHRHWPSRLTQTRSHGRQRLQGPEHLCESRHAAPGGARTLTHRTPIAARQVGSGRTA